MEREHEFLFVLSHVCQNHVRPRGSLANAAGFLNYFKAGPATGAVAVVAAPLPPTTLPLAS